MPTFDEERRMVEREDELRNRRYRETGLIFCPACGVEHHEDDEHECKFSDRGNP